MAVRFRLRELLEEAGVSQTEAARRSGMSFATINRLCTNATHQVSLETIERLCVAFDVEPGDLFEREGGRGSRGGQGARRATPTGERRRS